MSRLTCQRSIRAVPGELISLTRTRTTTGHCLHPAGTFVVGAIDGVGLLGIPAAELGAGDRSLVVVATSEPVDLGMLATSSLGLEAQLTESDTRDLETPTRDSGFLVARRALAVDDMKPSFVVEARSAEPVDLATRVTVARHTFPPSPARDHRPALLYVAADPRQTLSVSRECRRIEREIALTCGQRIGFHPRLGVTVDDLSRYLNEFRPTALHFSGHADPVRGLAFETDAGTSHWVSAATLASTLRAARPDLTVLLLGACFSSHLLDQLGGSAACVIGMRGAIPDAAARAFAVGFYRSLNGGEPVGRAVDEGRAQVARDDVDGFAGVDVVVRPGVDIGTLRLPRFAEHARPTPSPGRPPTERELQALGCLIDLDGALTSNERAGLAAETAPSTGVVATLRRLAVLLGRTRDRVAAREVGADADVDHMLGAATERFDLRRGVITPVVVAGDRDSAEPCRRGLAFDLDVWIESHRELLTRAGVPVMRAPVVVQLDPGAVVSSTTSEALSEHAEAMRRLFHRLRDEHLGEDDWVDAGELLPVPGTVAFDRIDIPIPTPKRAVVRLSVGGRVLIEIPATNGHSVTVSVAELPAACPIRWEVIAPDVFRRDEIRAAGWFRVATNDEAAAFAATRDPAEWFRLGAWDDVVRALWPRTREPTFVDDGMLRQLVRHEHEWLAIHCPGWDRRARCGRALSWLARDDGDRIER